MIGTIQIPVFTVNGESLETPAILNFVPKLLVPIGVQNIREFDENYCIVVNKIFTFRSGTDVFGSKVFKSENEFYAYIQSSKSTTYFDMQSKKFVVGETGGPVAGSSTFTADFLKDPVDYIILDNTTLNNIEPDPDFTQNVSTKTIS